MIIIQQTGNSKMEIKTSAKEIENASHAVRLQMAQRDWEVQQEQQIDNSQAYDFNEVNVNELSL